MPDKPPLLVLAQYHRSTAKARAYVLELLSRFDVASPPGGWSTATLSWPGRDGKPTGQVATFPELVDEARRTGVVARLCRFLDRKDVVFGGETGELATPNHQMKIRSEYAGQSVEAAGPCRSASIVTDLMEDILDYRARVCWHSSEYDFRLCCRFFRAYLSSCITLVEAFINRHVLVAGHEGFSSPEFEALKSETRLEERVKLWWKFCSLNDPSSFFASKAWCHFQEIRTKRNLLLHAAHPIVVYSLREIAEYLNKVNSGVGDLLLEMRKAHGNKPTLMFIERIRTAPKVRFRRTTFMADGRHRVKEVQ